jgi:uncharacterized protein (TIGR03066 family)
MRSLCVAALGAVMIVCAGTARAQDDNAKKIVGAWEVTKSANDLPIGTIVEFKDGKLRVAMKMNGADITYEGTYNVEKDQLTIKMKIGDQDLNATSTIKKLSDDALEIEDKDKKIDILKKKK